MKFTTTFAKDPDSTQQSRSRYFLAMIFYIL